jgi:molecular chaperone DnaJ
MDPYQVLGVRRNATLAEIRRAYQKHARRLHPDLNPGDPAASRQFQALSAAFEILTDPRRRAEYDRGEVSPPRPRVPEVGFAGFDFSAEIQTTAGAGFRQIFEGVLRAREPVPPPPARGEDLEHSALLSFDEAFRGASRRVNLVRQRACEACRGTGDVPAAPHPCPACGGTGQVRARRGRMIFTRRCPECGATGVLSRLPCARCGGEGRVMQGEWTEVRVPPGAADGDRIRVPGLGNAGRRGGPPGDFHLVLRVEPHPVYRRQRDDLYCEVPVTMTEAALGAHVEVPTPDGPVTIEIPAGTQTGQRFRMRKRGMPRRDGAGRGDLYVEARVWVPAVRDDRSRELLREFERRNAQDPRGELARRAGGKAR